MTGPHSLESESFLFLRLVSAGERPNLMLRPVETTLYSVTLVNPLY